MTITTGRVAAAAGATHVGISACIITCRDSSSCCVAADCSIGNGSYAVRLIEYSASPRPGTVPAGVAAIAAVTACAACAVGAIGTVCAAGSGAATGTTGTAFAAIAAGAGISTVGTQPLQSVTVSYCTILYCRLTTRGEVYCAA